MAAVWSDAYSWCQQLLTSPLSQSPPRQVHRYTYTQILQQSSYQSAGPAPETGYLPWGPGNLDAAARRTVKIIESSSEVSLVMCRGTRPQCRYIQSHQTACWKKPCNGGWTGMGYRVRIIISLSSKRSGGKRSAILIIQILNCCTATMELCFYLSFSLTKWTLIFLFVCVCVCDLASRRRLETLWETKTSQGKQRLG